MTCVSIGDELYEMPIEGAAAVAVAGWLKTADRYAGANVTIVICGGNIDAATLRRLV